MKKRIISFLFISSLFFSEIWCADFVGRALDLANSINALKGQPATSPVTPTQQTPANQPATQPSTQPSTQPAAPSVTPAQPVAQIPVCDLGGRSLAELNIDITVGQTTVHLPFVSSPWPTIPVISDLSFIPAGTTSFTLMVYGYDTSNNHINSLSDLVRAIQSSTLSGFGVYLYDQNNQSIGTPISLPSAVSTQLVGVLQAGSPSIVLGVNSALAATTAPLSYPIQITLKNIANWAPVQSTTQPVTPAQPTDPIPTIQALSQLMQWKTFNKISKATTFTGNFPNFNFNINGDTQYGPGSQGWYGGYAFLMDPWNTTTAPFNNGRGVAADLLPLRGEMMQAFNAGAVSLALVAADGSGNFISDLTKTTPVTMYLYVFDTLGTIIGQPISFPASNAIQLPSAGLQFSNNTFAMGLASTGFTQLTYPFVITIENSATSQAITLQKIMSSFQMTSAAASISISTQPVFVLNNTYYIAINSVLPSGLNPSVLKANISTLISNLQPPFSVFFAAVDSNNNIMNSISSSNKPDSYVLYVFDRTGKSLTPTPITLAQSSEIYLSSNPNVMNLSYIDVQGNSIDSNLSMNYPFIIQVTA